MGAHACVFAYREHMHSLATGWTWEHGAAAASPTAQSSSASATPTTGNLLENLVLRHSPSFPETESVPRRLSFQALLSTFKMSHAMQGETSGYLWLCIFSRRTVQHPPLLNRRFFGNGMTVVCQLSLNHSYHQTGSKIK